MSKLTELQEKWIAEMEAHPERQYISGLGKIDWDGNIRACCLGQGLLCLRGDSVWVNGRIEDIEEGSYLYPSVSFKELGLRDMKGTFINRVRIRYGYGSLAEMNDYGLTWTQIAQYMREHPENVFVL